MPTPPQGDRIEDRKPTDEDKRDATTQQAGAEDATIEDLPLKDDESEDVHGGAGVSFLIDVAARR